MPFHKVCTRCAETPCSIMYRALSCETQTKQWAKREEQIERVMGGTIGMYGDLQGIAGKSLQEIEGLEFQALELDLDPPAAGA